MSNNKPHLEICLNCDGFGEVTDGEGSKKECPKCGGEGAIDN